jgi:beta-phosphoglucomutase-like phosphatase (HAD superfamily)
LAAAAFLETDPADCLVVEDSPTGLESALLGGIPAAGLETNFNAAFLSQPVPGRPDLQPWKIFPTIQDLFVELERRASAMT